MNSAPPHLTDKSKKALKEANTAYCIIPGGMTRFLQPLDISVNKSFKNNIRNEWQNWMINNKHEFTKSGRTKKASYVTVCEWILKALDSVSKDCIVNGFAKANLINDGSVNPPEEPPIFSTICLIKTEKSTEHEDSNSLEFYSVNSDQDSSEY